MIDFDYRQGDDETDEKYADRVVRRCDHLESELAQLRQLLGAAILRLQELGDTRFNMPSLDAACEPQHYAEGEKK